MTACYSYSVTAAFQAAGIGTRVRHRTTRPLRRRRRKARPVMRVCRVLLRALVGEQRPRPCRPARRCGQAPRRTKGRPSDSRSLGARAPARRGTPRRPVARGASLCPGRRIADRRARWLCRRRCCIGWRGSASDVELLIDNIRDLDLPHWLSNKITYLDPSRRSTLRDARSHLTALGPGRRSDGACCRTRLRYRRTSIGDDGRSQAHLAQAGRGSGAAGLRRRCHLRRYLLRPESCGVRQPERCATGIGFTRSPAPRCSRAATTATGLRA